MIINFLDNSFEEIDEKVLLIAIIGSLEAIRSGAISVDEAEKFLFSPYMTKKLREKKCNKKIVKLIEKGCELEDIVSLMPNVVDVVIDEIKLEALKILEGYKEYNEVFWLVESKQLC